MTYETTDALFAGICDEIRAKDGTTALIRHQDIPARISAISGGGEDFFAVPIPDDIVEYKGLESDGTSAKNKEISTNEVRLVLRKSFSFFRNGFDCGIFKLKKQLPMEYSTIALTGKFGIDGGGITEKVYIKVADSIPEQVSGQRYDFSDWILIKETNQYLGSAAEETITIQNEGFTGRFLYIGILHGDESEVYTAQFAIKSIILNM